MLGFSGLLLCHNITFFLTEMWFVIYCIVQWKMILKRKKRLYAILFAEAGDIPSDGMVFLPMLEQLDSGKYCISTYFNDPEALGESGWILKAYLISFSTTMILSAGQTAWEKQFFHCCISRCRRTGAQASSGI